MNWVRYEAAWDPEVVAQPPRTNSVEVLPHCWFVELTFAWLGTCRRVSKDYEHRVSSSVAMIRLVPNSLGRAR